MGKLPASLFYWGDFIRDPDLRRCSNAAVGVWIRLLCLMFECEPKGILATNGAPWSDEDIALAVGGRWEETNACLTELVTKGVASRNASGALMNRRMYRDEKIRDDTRERVRKFRGKQDCNAECNAQSNAVVRECTETVSEVLETEASVSSIKNTARPMTKIEVAELEEAIYEAYPRKVGRAGALKAIQHAVVRLEQGNLRRGPMEVGAARLWLLERTAEYARSPDGQKQVGQKDYRPHPQTWFNTERYFDDSNEWNQPQGGTHVNGNGKKSQTEQQHAHVQAAIHNLTSTQDSGGGGGRQIGTGAGQDTGIASPAGVGGEPGSLSSRAADWGL
ncbi:MAG: hypothetical protein WCA44_05975 [Acidobacteriaceae bacterium]